MSTLFQKYGGFAAVSKVVMAFYDKVLDSDDLAPYFEHIDMRRLIDHQTKFISQVMGGPASYTNDALSRVHAPHNIDQAAFNEVAALLNETLIEFGLETDDIAVIMDEVGSKARFVVENSAGQA